MVHMLYISVLNIALPTIFRRLSPSPLLCEKENEPPDRRETRLSRQLRVILTVELRQIFIFAIGYIGGCDISTGVHTYSTFSVDGYTLTMHAITLQNSHLMVYMK